MTNNNAAKRKIDRQNCLIKEAVLKTTATPKKALLPLSGIAV